MKRANVFATTFARLIALFVLALAAPAWSKDVPYLTARVNDQAGILSDEVVRRLDIKLAQLEDSTGVQVVILIESSLDGEDLEEYTLKVATTWKLGRKEHDDGLLFYIAQDDRKMRIEVGYGLEGKLNDGLCGRILDTYVVPRFRDGEFDGGVEAGIDVIASLLNGNVELPDPPANSGFAIGGEKPDWKFILMFMGMFFVVIGLFSFIAVSIPEPVLFLYFFLMPFYALFPMAVLGPKGGLASLLFWILAYPIARTILHGKPFTKGTKSRWKWVQNIRMSSGGSGSGGGFHSSSSSGSSFSGGGGSFGGGGSSRSW